MSLKKEKSMRPLHTHRIRKCFKEVSLANRHSISLAKAQVNPTNLTRTSNATPLLEPLQLMNQQIDLQDFLKKQMQKLTIGSQKSVEKTHTIPIA